MFYDDIILVTNQIKKYGLRKPMCDLGGLAKPTIARYGLTLATGDQHARYVTLPNGARPFDHLDPSYRIFNPENGDPDIETMARDHSSEFGTIICCNVIEHVTHPFHVFEAFYEMTARGGLVIVTTVLSFPVHGAPIDMFRYTPDCLKMLGEYAGFEVLEYDFHLRIYGDEGIKDIHTMNAQEIHADYVTMRKT